MFRRRLPPLEYDSAPYADMARQAFPGLENAPPVGPGLAEAPRQGLFGRARNWLSQQNEQGLTGADRLYAIGGALKDLDWTSGGGHFDAAMQRNDQQRERFEQERKRQEYAEAMREIFADGTVDPQELVGLPGVGIGDILSYQESLRPEIKIDERGVFEIGPDGSFKMLQRLAPEAEKGFMWDENGRLTPIPGGPADPDYIRRTWRPRESDEGDGHADSRDPWNQNW